MARNIEIKARSCSFDRQMQIAGWIADGPPVRIAQEDTFFYVRAGRLKLREFGDGTAELIQYERADSAGPSQSTYTRSPAPDPLSLKQALASALGIRAVVKKKRTVFKTGQTRIHLDEVAGLGQFIELEVVLDPAQTSAEGVALAEDLISQLGIDASDRIADAYVDLLAAESVQSSPGC